MTPELWAALIMSGGPSGQTPEQMLAQAETSKHSADPRGGCGGCFDLAQLFHAWLEGEPVGDPNTWQVSDVDVEHLASWLRAWHSPPPTELVAFMAEIGHA
jgi:hypothetical protein